MAWFFSWVRRVDVSFFCILFVLKEIRKVLFLNPDFVGIYELLRTNTCKRRSAGIASLDCSWCWHVLTIWSTKLNKYKQDALSMLSLSSCLLKTNSSRKCPFQSSVNSTIGVSTEKDLKTAWNVWKKHPISWFILSFGHAHSWPVGRFPTKSSQTAVSVMWSTSVGFIRLSFHLHSVDPYLLVIVTEVSSWWLQLRSWKKRMSKWIIPLILKDENSKYVQHHHLGPSFLSLIGDCLPADFFFCSSPSLDLSCDEFHYQSVAGEHGLWNVRKKSLNINLHSYYPQALA